MRLVKVNLRLMERFLSFILKFINEVRRRTYLKRIKQIHIEEYFFDDVWLFIRRFPYPKRVTWYVMPPANSEFYKVRLGLDKQQIEPKMSARLRWMKQHNYPMGLHIHFYKRGDMPINKMRSLIAEAKAWGLSNGIDFKKIVPGWFNYTSNLAKLCDEFGLVLVQREPSAHDYNLKPFKG